MLRERRARLFGEAVGQILTLGIVPDVLEWQHGERDPRTQCAGTAAVPPDEAGGANQSDGKERGEHRDPSPGVLTRTQRRFRRARHNRWRNLRRWSDIR